MFLVVFLLASLLGAAQSANVPGLDVSQAVSKSVADCFVSQGYKYVIARAWLCVNGGTDSAAITTHNNLRAAGMPHVGFYIYPCVGRSQCASAASQINSVKTFLTTNKLTADSVWLDIEGGGGCAWSSNTDTNKQFYIDMLAAAKAAWPDRYGVYSSRVMWQSLFGSQSWVNPGDDKLKLWYAHYDKVPNFSTFMTFSSWPTNTKPYAKQYEGNVKVCNFNVDVNTAPTFFGLTSDGSATPPPVITSCKFGSLSGTCTNTNECPEPKQWVASSAGATGCELLPNEIKCCVSNSSPSTTVPCNYNGANGQCIASATCLSSKKQSIPSANGAKGCESLPSDVRCCIDASQTNAPGQTNAPNQPTTTTAPTQPGQTTTTSSFSPNQPTTPTVSLSVVAEQPITTSSGARAVASIAIIATTTVASVCFI